MIVSAWKRRTYLLAVVRPRRVCLFQLRSQIGWIESRLRGTLWALRLELLRSLPTTCAQTVFIRVLDVTELGLPCT